MLEDEWKYDLLNKGNQLFLLYENELNIYINKNYFYNYPFLITFEIFI